MSERYTRLFSLQKNLYLTGAPVILEAGALLRDNVKDKLLAQLKLRSISEKNVKAVTVQVTPLDTAGRKLNGSVVYPYLDLDIRRDAEFGEQTPIYLNEPTARAFWVCVTEVVFIDNSVWSADAVEWTHLPEPKDLAAVLNPEQVRQYRIDNGKDCRFVPQKIRDLWYCACGACNRNTEKDCFVCKRPQSQCMTKSDISKLDMEVNARLAKEREEAATKQAALAAERAKRAAAEAEAAKKKRKIAAIIAALVLAAVVIAAFVDCVVIPNKQYNDAVALYEAGEYDMAIVAFEAMDGYKDSDEKVAEIESVIEAGKAE